MELKDNRRRRMLPLTKEGFLERIQIPDGCWLYDGAREINGYGYLKNPFGDAPKYITAHRASWIFHNGPIPEGMGVLHRCDIRGCVNPAHLFLGTDADNASDKYRKMRFKGKLSLEDVQEIRRLSAPYAGKKRTPNRFNLDLAEKYGVSDKAISAIRNGHKWKMIP